ncbi:MAG: glycosyltransferase [Eubacteriales bacterium]
MKIIYASCLCSKEKFADLFKDSDKMPGQQVQKYHRLIVEGLIENNIDVQVVTVLPITRMNCKRIYLKREQEVNNEIKYYYLPILNIPVLKNIISLINSFWYVFIKCFRNRNYCVIGDVLNISACAGALCAAKILKIRNIGIVTDIPSLLSKNKNSLSVKISTQLISSFDSYVFLTENMNGLVNKKGKPYLVIEGQVDINMRDFENEFNGKHDKKICIYAGGLQKIYGIGILVDAFLLANVENAELHLYGNGDFEDELKEICRKHTSIRYFGVMPNDYIVSEEIKATLLINPRPTSEEYTKYSFPSKNMEYMASGTSVLSTKLLGMPEEYYPYVFLIEDESVEGLAKALRNVLSMDPAKLHENGLRAKEFVIKEKNNVIQASKILRLF